MKPRRHFKKKTIFLISTLVVSSLVSVGFANWATGIEQSSSITSANINVSGSNNNTIIVETKCTKNSIIIDADPDYVNENAVVKPSLDSKKDMSIPTNLKIISSKNITLNSINVTLNINENKNVINVGSDDLFRTSGEYFYFDINVKEVTNFEFLPYEDLEEYQVANVNLSNLEVVYSTFFNKQDPLEFYNSKLLEYKKAYLEADETTKEDKRILFLKAISQAKKELETMSNSINGATIDIHFEAKYLFN